MGQQYEMLKARLMTVRNLQKAAAVLDWDQETKMPPGGVRARAEQLSTLSRLSHTLFIDPETERLLAAAAEDVADRPYDSDEASLVRVAQRDYDRSKKVPTDLVAAMTRHSALAYEIWVQARKHDDYASFAPCLQTTLDLSRQRAEYLGYEENLYDALLDQFEPGMRASRVESIFNGLKTDLIPLVEAIAARSDLVSDSPVHGEFDEGAQEQFGKMIAAAIGYDFSRGRQDRSIHPFETAFSRDDVRITTRFEPTFLNPALFGTMHESGHAMYEQGVGAELEGTLLARGASSALHESQSRLWENVVGRSLGFWKHFYPKLQNAFPAELGSVDLGAFYSAINKVVPSLIRVEADEVTYTLHIMLRFEMELGLLNGSISVADAPEAWNEKMQAYLGVTPPNDALGILQDVHWSGGMFGYFPTYALGTVLSLQLYDTALAADPQIPLQISGGKFDRLRGWLTENIYRHGRKYLPDELVTRATGRPLETGPYMTYLREKFGQLYGL